ncbi:RNA polymerase sigma factor [Micromonospora okii]|uniref:RNA polymerase sigma factor n=1 Tax=Micromonospora okii TaxID=1182970 RepID=UPI001E36F021|nr:sigma-70 family RNA polymerase sigma factor [Micromonospora okii]
MDEYTSELTSSGERNPGHTQLRSDRDYLPGQACRNETTPDSRVAEFSAFYREDAARLVGFLIAQGIPAVDAPDVAQEAMRKAFINWTKIENPRAWVRKVASREYARMVGSADESPAGDIVERTPLLRVAPAVIEEWELRHVLLAALRKLPSRQRQVMVWNLEDYKPAEIAKQLKVTPDAVRSSLLKARQELAKHLDYWPTMRQRARGGEDE